MCNGLNKYVVDYKHSLVQILCAYLAPGIHKWNKFTILFILILKIKWDAWRLALPAHLVSGEGSEQGHVTCLDLLLPFVATVEIFGLGAAAEEQHVCCDRGGKEALKLRNAG